MTDTHHESDYSRGFRHGQQDGATPSSNEAEADMHPPSGNQRMDEGYTDGFHQARQSQRREAFRELAASIARGLRLNALADRLAERHNQPTATQGHQ
jgi:hypothetical protein